ncbi:MAG: TfoX/Sxy family protein [Cytophagales bacterium]|nr:TfoX/Sxy family protein [Cytophagales bacterium]
MANALETVPNIGKTLAIRLSQVGIDCREKLLSIGAEDTFIKIKTIDKHACLNMLYALEGAIQGIRWHKLSEDRKRELREFYNMLN